MEGRYHVNVRCYIMSLWTMVVIVLMLPHYSESTCNVANCNPSHCNGYLCDVCNDGYYVDSKTCIPCQQSLQNCVACSNNTSCTKCNDGYYLKHGSSCVQCQEAQPSCVACSNSWSCTKCTDGYYLQSEWCVPCQDRCATCKNYTQCTTCKDMYWNGDNKCDSYCSANCLNRQCDVSTGFCNSCIKGKYGPQCGQDCNLCRDGKCNIRTCTNGCKDGYYQENTVSGYSYCLNCAYNCLTCSNGTYCTQCEQGYYRNYFRHELSGRGIANCLQCYESCMDCTSTERCHNNCTHHCSEPENPGTTNSAYETTIIQSTTSESSTSKTEIPTQTQKTSESIKSTESTLTEDFYNELHSCQQQIKTCYENEDQNQLTFGHGFATGFGVAIVLFGSGLGIALFIRRQTKQHKHADENSEGHHEYVNTNITDSLSVISSENNEVTNDNYTVSSDSTTGGVTNIDSSRDYVLLRDRPTHESNYTELQNT